MPMIKTVHVEAGMGKGFQIQSNIRGHELSVDQPKAAGGTDSGPTPLEYLFLSLAGCIASIARIVANQQKIDLRGMDIKVSGDLDVETLLGKAQISRAGFTGLKVTAKIDADLSPEEKKDFLRQVDRRCPVSDNLANTTPLSVELVE